MSEIDEALEACVRHTGVERYRWLCSDANTFPPPNSAGDYRRWVLSRAWEGRPAIAVDYSPVVPSAGCGGCGR